MDAFEMKWKKVLPILCMVAIGVGVLLINLLWVPDHDALMYAFGRMSTTEQSTRIASFADIVRQQMTDYVTPGKNGRVFVHGLCTFFMGFKLYTLFKLLNTAMWCLFTWLVLRTGGLTREKTSLWGWAFGVAVVWWFCWYGETALNAAFAMNYLWTATATLILFALWKRLKWWMVPFAFLYGWSQECFVLPALAALGGSMVVRSIVERRRAFTWQQALAWILMLAGACFLCFGPASQSRALDVYPDGLRSFVWLFVKIQGKFILLFWPPVLFVCLAIALWRKSRTSSSFGSFCASFLSSLEWWLYLVAGYGMYTVLVIINYLHDRGGELRMSSAVLLPLVVLVLRYRQWLAVSRWVYVFGVCFLVLWVGGATVLQYKATLDLKDCLSRYCADPQGITSLPNIKAGPLRHSFWHTTYSWGGVAFMREYGKTVPITSFAPWLYRSLYLEPEKFFAEAVPVPGTPCYTTPKAPRVLVAKGDVFPSVEACAVMKKQIALNCKVRSLPRFVPGRVAYLFSKRDDKRQWFNSARFVFTAKDGKVYTIFSGYKPEEWLEVNTH